MVEVGLGFSDKGVEIPSLFLCEEGHFDREIKGAYLHLLWDVFVVKQPLGIFFGSHQKVERMTAAEMPDMVDVASREVVVVRITFGDDIIVVVHQMNPDWFRLGYAGEHIDISGIYIAVVSDSFEYRFGLTISDCREEDLLVGRDMVESDDLVAFFHLQILRTFGDDYGICSVDLFGQVAQTAQRKEFILEDRMAVIDQKYVFRRSDATILESVIENDDLRRGRKGEQLVDTLFSILAAGHRHVREFSLDLKRFVSGHLRVGVGFHQNEALGLAFVAAGEDCRTETWRELIQDVFYGRGFAGTTNGDIAYTDDRGHPGTGFKLALVV